MATYNSSYARKLAEEKARAAGLSKEEIKSAGKAAVSEYYKNSVQFKSAQDAELIALKNQGLSSKQINAEKKANSLEYNNFIKSYFDGTAGTAAGQKLSDFRSTASTYSGDIANNVAGLLNGAANKYSELNIASKTKSGDTTIGLGLDSLVNYELGKSSNNVNKLIERGNTYVGKTFTQDQLTSDGVKIKEVKNAPGVYQWSSGGGETKSIVYFKKNDDGTFTGSGLNRTYTPQQDNNGFLGLGPIGGALALGAIGYFGGPLLASQFGATGAVASGIAGGFLGGAASAATGYDPLAGALTAGSAGAFAGGGGFGGEGVFGGDVESQVGGFYGQTTPSVLPPTDYSLLAGSNIPAQSQTMGLGTGLESTLPPLPDASAIGIQPVDYSLAGQVTPGVVGGVGLQVPEMPNIGSMGGGQGLTVPVEGGTVGQLGFTPTGATPSLGSPDSFINNPEVTGQPVLAQGTSTPLSISPLQAVRAASLANSLLNPPQAQPQIPNLLAQAQGGGATGVDYSGILSLLQQRAKTSGLLGTTFRPQQINLSSLLG